MRCTVAGLKQAGNKGCTRFMALQDSVTQTVTGLGYEFVELERSAGGLLRVTIDHPWAGLGSTPQPITVDDCERVTRQLQYVLEVEAVEYRRLEVSSPGIDRLLKSADELPRFEGEWVDLTLKAPMGSAAAGLVSPNRKKFRGQLQRVPVQMASATSEAIQWQIVWRDEPAVKPGQRVSAKRAAAPEQVLGFEWQELREMRLAPVVNFKGRSSKTEPGV